MYTVSIENFHDWRCHARELLRRAVAPEKVNWSELTQSSLDFSYLQENYLNLPIQVERPQVPRAFFALAELASQFRGSQRWPLLYNLAWRLVFENRELLDLVIDDQVARLNQMKKAVSRDKHKMKAFVRFQSAAVDTESMQTEQFIAWFEPDHFIVESTAPFFVKRFTNMSWSILTPDLCAHWDQQTLAFTQGVQKTKQQDSLETLWLEYYKNIFNPARLKTKAMQAEMPKKYWRNLPEASLIHSLIKSSGEQTSKMLASKHSDSSKVSNASYVKKKQKQLRVKKSSHTDIRQ